MVWFFMEETGEARVNVYKGFLAESYLKFFLERTFVVLVSIMNIGEASKWA